ncbi:MAG TPA: hypothetical protein VIX86_04350 [Streptosporangiaceae bacterium]
MLPYVAYLRVYEPLSAFTEPDSTRWAAYAASADRPRRAGALAAEHADALRRLTAMTPVAAPEWESGDAYVRWVDGITYICPWQTRLRSWLGLSRLRATAPQLRLAALPPAAVDAAVTGFANCRGQPGVLRIHIQASTWSVPPAWFLPFAPDERWLVLDGQPGPLGGRAGAGEAGAPARALLYSTAMPLARARVRAALDSCRCADGAAGAGAGSGPGAGGPAELAQILSWLAEFDPQSLVELDYGGLVHLLSDDALRADQSVAEMSAAVNALARGEPELATAMYRRVTRRWQPLAGLEHAS